MLFRSASTYTKPELPEEAKENTERGAEAAAEHYLATLTYAWNTGDTHALTNMSAAEVPFTDGYVDAINRRRCQWVVAMSWLNASVGVR